MRLLRAELRKLNRPLTWGVTGAAALFCVLLAMGGAHNAQAAAAAAPRPPSCATMGVPAGPACTQATAIERARYSRAHADQVAAEVQTAAQLNPVAAGAEAAGLMASLPGALALALLAGGHIGGEWSGRTMKNLLTQHGRRWQVLGAKLVSLWLAGIGLIAACWLALAAAGPVVSRLNHLPNPHYSLHGALTLASSQVARSLLVLAAFAATGLLAAVLTRNTIGVATSTAGVFVGMLVVTALPGLGRWTPATWVQGWMGFPAGLASITPLPTNFWSRFINASGSPPSHLLGLTGLSALLLAFGAITARIFTRADISG